MSQNRRSFLLGVFFTLFVMGLLFLVLQGWPFIQAFTSNTIDNTQQIPKLVPQDAVRIQTLPPLLTLKDSLSFNGKKSFPQKIIGRYAQNIQIIRFNAEGENSHKSTLKIVWEDGTTELFYPGTIMKQLPSGKRAREISISGYAVHERRIFPDSSRPGTLEWEIHYEAVPAGI